MEDIWVNPDEYPASTQVLVIETATAVALTAAGVPNDANALGMERRVTKLEERVLHADPDWLWGERGPTPARKARFEKELAAKSLTLMFDDQSEPP